MDSHRFRRCFEGGLDVTAREIRSSTSEQRDGGTAHSHGALDQWLSHLDERLLEKVGYPSYPLKEHVQSGLCRATAPREGY
jgi:hypothetical protein